MMPETSKTSYDDGGRMLNQVNANDENIIHVNDYYDYIDWGIPKWAEIIETSSQNRDLFVSATFIQRGKELHKIIQVIYTRSFE